MSEARKIEIELVLHELEELSARIMHELAGEPILVGIKALLMVIANQLIDIKLTTSGSNAFYIYSESQEREARVEEFNALIEKWIDQGIDATDLLLELVGCVQAIIGNHHILDPSLTRPQSKGGT
jgi:hypothetical protein